MTYNNDTFNKISIIKKDGKVGVLTESELMRTKVSNVVPIKLGSRVVFELTGREFRGIREDYLKRAC